MTKATGCRRPEPAWFGQVPAVRGCSVRDERARPVAPRIWVFATDEVLAIHTGLMQGSG